MIVYNNRYRGPMEYDKFILNTLQYVNEVNMILKNEFYNSESQIAFKQLCDNVDQIYQARINMSEELALKMIEMQEV